MELVVTTPPLMVLSLKTLLCVGCGCFLGGGLRYLTSYLHCHHHHGQHPLLHRGLCRSQPRAAITGTSCPTPAGGGHRLCFQIKEKGHLLAAAGCRTSQSQLVKRGRSRLGDESCKMNCNSSINRGFRGNAAPRNPAKWLTAQRISYRAQWWCRWCRGQGCCQP